MDSNAPTTTSNDNGASAFFPCGQFNSTQLNRPILWFNLSSIPKDAVVSSAILKLNVNSEFCDTAHTMNIYRCRRRTYLIDTSTRTWASHATWNRYRHDKALAWSTVGCDDTTNDREATTIGTLAVSTSMSGAKTVTLDAAKVQEWIDGTFPMQGLVMIASNEGPTNTMIRYSGSQTTNTALRPQIDITYTSAIEALGVTDNLEGYWKFDAASGSYVDSSGNGHTLTPVNAPTFVTGILGEAAHVVRASDQYFSNSDAALRLGDSDWTITAWIKLTNKTVDFHGIVGQGRDDGGAGGNGGAFAMHHGTGLDRLVGHLHDDETQVPGDPLIADPVNLQTSFPAAGSWAFVVMRHDAARKFLHISTNDGPLDSAGHHGTHESKGADCAYMGTLAASTAPFTIGKFNYNASPGYVANGDIDNVMLHQRWLSPANITQLYGAGAGYDPFPASSSFSPAAVRGARRSRRWI